MKLEELILNHSRQVDDLRKKAINLDKQTLQEFCNVILKLLKSPNHQPEAYHQINEFIVTAKSDLIAIVDRKVLSEVAKTHTREDLDEYIVLWKRIMPGTANRTLYPNMEERFKNTKVAQSNGYLSRRLVNAQKTFQDNFISLDDRMQFFSAHEDSFLSESIDNGNGSMIVEMDIRQISKIKKKLQEEQVDELTMDEYLKKINNFLSLNPKYVKRQQNQEFNAYQTWARQLIKNKKNDLTKTKKSPSQQRRKTTPTKPNSNKNLTPQKIAVRSFKTNDILLHAEVTQYYQQEAKNLKRKTFKKKQQKWQTPQRQIPPNGWISPQKYNTSPNNKRGRNYQFDQNHFSTSTAMRSRRRNRQTENDSFSNKTFQPTNENSKKLSDLNREKKKRLEKVTEEKLGEIQNYVFQPYIINFYQLSHFNRFRRNSLSNNMVLYSSPLVQISCSLDRVADSKVKVEIDFKNKSSIDFAIETLYRIPKCFKVGKNSEVKKNWILKQQGYHNFNLQLQSFPIEPCILNLKYEISTKYGIFNQTQPTRLVIPITLRNCLEYLLLEKGEWMEKWSNLAERGNFRIAKHVILDKNVISEDKIDHILKEFVVLNPIEGYSIRQLGAYCRQSNLNMLTFLMRITQRVQNLMTLQILVEGKIRNQDEVDFLEYCLDLWCMLLSKIQKVQMHLQNESDH